MAWGTAIHRKHRTSSHGLRLLLMSSFPRPGMGSKVSARRPVMKIVSLDTALYRIELPVPLSDSTHGTMTHFELITVRLRDADGVEGVGYTYTTGAGGAAVHALIDQGLRPVVIGADADLIEALWNKMWWRLHYGGGGGGDVFSVFSAAFAMHSVVC